MTDEEPFVSQARPKSARERLRPYGTSSGMLLAAAGVPAAIVEATVGSVTLAPRVLQLAAAGVTSLLLLSGLCIVRLPRFGRLLATLAILGLFGLASSYLLRAPLGALVSLIVGSSALALLWKVGAPLLEWSRPRRRPVFEGQAQGAAILALALCFLGVFVWARSSPLDVWVVGWALGLSVAFGLEWALRNLRVHRSRALTLLGSVVVAGLLIPLLWGQGWWVMSSLMAVAGTSTLLIRRPRRLEMEQNSWWEPLLGHPERLFVGTFAGLCLVGTVLLALPQSAASGRSIGFIDAAFTSTSAVCVTGLIVLDTPVAFSVFGQGALLLLIQVGGLGIMTFSTAALWALGQRMSLRHEGAVASLISTQDRGRLFATARSILLFTLLAEAAGAGILTAAFVGHGDGLGRALWHGVFTSISAFCNAGFALQSASLIPYQHSPVVLHTVALLIILGGLSPLAVFALPHIVRRSVKPVSAQARLALATTLVLLVTGFLFILAFEWSDSLAGLSLLDRIHNAWFQSVTLRTAGFNSVDIAASRSATLTLMLVWMFIGGSPGGTAGGVKTTTVAVLVLSVVHAITGRWTLEAFGKRISERTRSKAAVTVVVAAAGAVVALVAIQLTQRMSTRMAVFEVVSALGTVGLSIGGTAALDGIGKAIIIGCMFVGRVGGLTLLMFTSSHRTPPTIARPEEQIDVG